MLKTRKEMREIEEIEDIICNKCGNSCKNERTGFIEAVPFVMIWGYGSGKDGEGHKSHLCETCYDSIVAEFKIPPEIHEHLLIGDCECERQYVLR